MEKDSIHYLRRYGVDKDQEKFFDRYVEQLS